VRLAGEDDLERMAASDRGEPLDIGKQQQRPLVARHAAREADDRPPGVEQDAGELLHARDQLGLRRQMAAPDLVGVELAGAREHLGFVLPMREVRVVQVRERLVRPGADVHAVGDRAHAVAGKEPPGRARVALGDAVDPG
jgi:hypothetical protein